MGDVVFVLATIVFFAVCALYVGWCDRIVGTDEFVSVTADESPTGGSPTGGSHTGDELEVAA